MKIFFFMLIFLFGVGLELPLKAAGEDSLLVAFWNLENFFDWKDDGNSSSDKEFSSQGVKRWTRSRFYAKAGAVAKTLPRLAPAGDRLPDVVGFAEIENRFVVRSIISSTFLSRYDYDLVHYDSPDPRGIDCALIYRRTRFRKVDSSIRRLDTGHPTRDILAVRFITLAGDSLVVFVNHHPSKYGGKKSEGRRRMAVQALLSLSDSLFAAGWRNQAAVGDFNDVPSSEVYDQLRPSLRCLSEPLEQKGEGSIRFGGQWELIDQVWVRGLEGKRVETWVVHLPELSVRDSAHAGTKPLRTYSGPRYLGGVSDHCPIVLNVVF